MNLVTSAQMSGIDAAAQSEFGIPGVVLMESAAKSAWDHLEHHLLSDAAAQSILFVAGAGNNGGDALVMARYCLLGGRHTPRVLLARDTLTGDAELQRSILAAMGLTMLVWARDANDAQHCIHSADWIVDGLSGTGVSGPLRSPYQEIAQAVNAAPGRVASIDVPSGVGDQVQDSEHSVSAEFTLTLGLPKRCLYDPAHRGKCGRISVIPFALPPQLISGARCSCQLLGVADLPGLIPPMAPTAHKGQRGALAVFAGSSGTAGAAVLSSRGALGAGAGLVTLFTHGDVYLPVASQLTSVMVRRESDSIGDGTKAGGLIDGFGAVVVGPGWGTAENRSQQLQQILGAYPSGVVDADGLTLLAAQSDSPALINWVLTPHPGELGRLLGLATQQVTADMFGSAIRAAKQYNCVVVAKASTTIVAHPDGLITVVDGMNPALATAGSGDVLSGVIGALLARGLSSWDAAQAGVILHSGAGRRLAQTAGFFRSTELPSEIGRLLGAIMLKVG